MKPWTMLLARLGIAGACIMAVGCGNSDVPDPGADEQAATEGAPPPDGAPAPPAAVPTQGKRFAVAAKPSAPKADESSDEDTAAAPAAESEKTATAPKSEGSSATAEMLAMATNSSSGGTSQPGTEATPGAAAGGTGAAAGSAGMMGMMNRPAGLPPGMPPGGPGGAGGPGGMSAQMRPGAMGAGGPSPGDMAKMMANNQMARAQGGQGGPGPGGRMGAAGMPGGPGGAGGLGGPGGQGRSPQDDKPGDFSNPEGAVTAFLAALSAKDQDRLMEACALRASVEPPEKNKILFRKIFDLSLSDSEMDDLSKSFEGYKIASENPPKSTGRIEVVLQKASEDGTSYTRVVTVRKEKKGWGVLLFRSPTEFKPLGQTPRRKGGNR